MCRVVIQIWLCGHRYASEPRPCREALQGLRICEIENVPALKNDQCINCRLRNSRHRPSTAEGEHAALPWVNESFGVGRRRATVRTPRRPMRLAGDLPIRDNGTSQVEPRYQNIAPSMPTTRVLSTDNYYVNTYYAVQEASNRLNRTLDEHQQQQDLQQQEQQYLQYLQQQQQQQQLSGSRWQQPHQQQNLQQGEGGGGGEQQQSPLVSPSMSTATTLVAEDTNNSTATTSSSRTSAVTSPPIRTRTTRSSAKSDNNNNNKKTECATTPTPSHP